MKTLFLICRVGLGQLAEILVICKPADMQLVQRECDVLMCMFIKCNRNC